MRRFREIIWPAVSILSLFGVIVGYYLDYRGLKEMGLSIQIWQMIGAGLFGTSILAILLGFRKKIARDEDERKQDSQLAGVEGIDLRDDGSFRVESLGFSFFPSRAILGKYFPFDQQLDSVDEMYALLVTGRKEMIELGDRSLEKIKKLILPNPKSSSLKNFTDSLEHIKDTDLTEGEIKILTDRLRRLNPGSVKWCEEFLGFTLLIGNPESVRAWVQIDWVPPFIEPRERLVFRIEKVQNKRLFNLYKGLFDKIWDDIIVELNDTEEPQ